MEDMLIILNKPEEIVSKRIQKVVQEAESVFFSQPDAKPILVPVSDGYTQFSGKDVRAISHRLNCQPNLFGVCFTVSVIPFDLDDYRTENYLEIRNRRAA